VFQPDLQVFEFIACGITSGLEFTASLGDEVGKLAQLVAVEDALPALLRLFQVPADAKPGRPFGTR
jgi:hypothetical protein